MLQRLQPVLNILDDGLALYRRHFLSFVMLSALAIVPVALLVTLMIVSSRYSGWSAPVETFLFLFMVLLIIILLPLAVSMIGWISRATAAVLDDKPVVLREVLAMRPGRVTLMGCFSLVYLFVVQMLSSIISMFIICPLYLLIAVLVVGFSENAPTTTMTTFLGFLVIFIVIVLYGFGFLISNAIYSSLVYALQPWIHESRPFGELIQRSLNLIGYRFWRNLLVWILAGAVVSALGITVLSLVGILLSLPLSFVLDISSATYSAISVCMWLLGFILIMPPMPIWMTLLYRKNSRTNEGRDLEEMVREWWHEHFEATTSA